MHPNRHINLAFSVICWSVFAFLVFYLLRTLCLSLDLKFAWGGFSPLIWVYKYFNPEFFVKDFPSGIELYSNSFFMYIYLLADRVLRISPEQLMPVIIGFEILLLSASVYVLTRTIYPETSKFVVLTILILLIASSARDMNLARFGEGFGGLYYNFARALRIFAIVFALKNKLAICAVMLAFSFITHPTIGVMGGVFILPILLYNYKSISIRDALKGIALFLLICGTWMLLTYDFSVLSASDFPHDVWVALTRAFTVHWYPVEYGLFGRYHYERWIQFLSFMLLALFYIGQINPLRAIDRKLILAMLVMALFVLMGIIASVFPFSPTLIKLSLHRGNDLIILVSLIYIVKGLVETIQHESLVHKYLASIILITPFLLLRGFPILWSSLLIIASCIYYRSKWFSFDRFKIWCLVFNLAILALFPVYYVLDYLRPWNTEAYTGLIQEYWLLPVLFGLLLITTLMQKFIRQPLLWIFILIITTYSAIAWINKREMDPARRDFAIHYKQAQEWARAETEPTALFMIEPNQAYSWRDYSLRSSFGTIREWLYSSWLYDSNYAKLQEGIRRLEELQLDWSDYVNDDWPLGGYWRMYRDVLNKYYEADDEWRLRLSEKYGIDYFVMRKDRIRKPSDFPIVYENKWYVIIAPN